MHEIGVILLFFINASTQLPLAEIIREVGLFLAVPLIALMALIALPDLVLWLSRLLGNLG